MSQESNQIGKLDWITVGLYALFVLLGWMSIYSAVYNPEAPLWIFDEAFYTSNAGRQLIWIGTSLVLIMLIFALDFRFFESFAPWFCRQIRRKDPRRPPLPLGIMKMGSGTPRKYFQFF